MDALVQYASHLNATHSSEILSLFTDDLRVYAEKNLGRSHYEYIARVLRGMRKLNGGKEAVKDEINHRKERFFVIMVVCRANVT